MKQNQDYNRKAKVSSLIFALSCIICFLISNVNAQDHPKIYIDNDEIQQGFFVLAQDITEKKQKDRELLKHRSELAHVSRLSTMGELTASLAHELNQPLTAILSNAQAALRFIRS